jgi:AcrR family transcriptional regulator
MPSSADTKERLLVVGRDAYLELGLRRFSLRDVARRVGVSAAAVYRYYPSKEALLDAIAAKGFETFGSHLVHALRARTPRARLLATGDRYLAFALSNPQDYRVIFMGDGASCEAPATPTAAPTVQVLVDRVRECVHAKVLARGDEVERALSIWAFVHGLASLRLAGHLGALGDDPGVARVYRRALERFVDDAAPRRAADRSAAHGKPGRA